MEKDIKKIILEEISKNKKIKVSDVVKITGFSRAYINRFFQELKKEEKIVSIGKANQVHYVLASDLENAKKDILSIRRVLENKNLSEDVVLEEMANNSGVFAGLPNNIAIIINYAFTEMLNNAIEHSKSKQIIVLAVKDKNIIKFEVIDCGVGIFKNIMFKKGLDTELDAIQDLLKGKQTTDAKKHSGEGIFFTSKIADNFSIQGSGKKIVFDNFINDIFIKDLTEIKGTKVDFEISVSSKKELNDIFKEYSGKAFEFSKTKIKVDLFEIDNAFISRSQARRILVGLDKFKEIILDFKNVETIGQGFADEVFRIWLNNNPEKKIEYQNANENVLFMIKRVKID